MKIFAKIKNNSIVRMVAALFICGVASAIVLVFVYKTTMPGIKKNRQNEMTRAINHIFPSGEGREEIAKETFKVFSGSGQLAGYAFTAEGSGYQGQIKLMVGCGPDLKQLKGIAVLESQETPGLGAEIQTEDFREQFDGLAIDHEIEYVKNRKPEKPYQIEAITGATISSRAVVSIINKKLKEIRSNPEVR